MRQRLAKLKVNQRENKAKGMSILQLLTEQADCNARIESGQDNIEDLKTINKLIDRHIKSHIENNSNIKLSEELAKDQSSSIKLKRKYDKTGQKRGRDTVKRFEMEQQLKILDKAITLLTDELDKKAKQTEEFSEASPRSSEEMSGGTQSIATDTSGLSDDSVSIRAADEIVVDPKKLSQLEQYVREISEYTQEILGTELKEAKTRHSTSHTRTTEEAVSDVQSEIRVAGNEIKVSTKMLANPPDHVKDIDDYLVIKNLIQGSLEDSRDIQVRLEDTENPPTDEKILYKGLNAHREYRERMQSKIKRMVNNFLAGKPMVEAKPAVSWTDQPRTEEPKKDEGLDAERQPTLGDHRK